VRAPTDRTPRPRGLPAAGLLGLVTLVAACAPVAAGEEVRASAITRCEAAAGELEAVTWPEDDDLTLRSVSAALADTAQVHRDLIADLAGMSDDTAGGRAVRELSEAAQPVVAALETTASAAGQDDNEGFEAGLQEVIRAGQAAMDASERLGLLPCYATPLPE
jgi:hypothetical protein